MSANVAPNIVKSGLVFEYDFANQKSYISGSNNCYDLIANRNLGTLTNGPTFTTANGGSLVFDGVNDYVETNTRLLDLVGSNPTGLTVEFFARFNTTLNFEGVIGDYSGNPINTGFALKTATSSMKLEFRSYAASRTIASVTTIPNDKFIQGFGIWTGSGLMHVGINGNIETTTNEAVGPWKHSSSSLRVGDIYGAMGVPANFNGPVSIIRIYNRALTSNEILQNYNALKSRFGL